MTNSPLVVGDPDYNCYKVTILPKESIMGGKSYDTPYDAWKVRDNWMECSGEGGMECVAFQSQFYVVYRDDWESLTGLTFPA